MTSIASIAGLAFAVTLLCVPLVKRAARRLQLMDVPDGRRKLHARATPLGGGVAILVGILAATAAALAINPAFSAAVNGTPLTSLGILTGACGLVFVGLVDDRLGLRGRQKLAGQILCAGCLIGTGVVIQSVELFGIRLELGLVSLPFTLFWFLGAINAFNLIDGIDGLASGVGLILSLALAMMAWYTGHPAEALFALMLAASLVAFLTFNFPPASIFLGDAGSMLIGLLLGMLAIRCSLKGPATVALAAPTAIWAIPILDTGMAILRRRLTGRSIYETDRGHLHHCLLRRGCSSRSTLLWIGLLCLVTAFGALLSVVAKSEVLAMGSAALVAAILVLTRLFGHSECQLLGQRLKHLILSLIPGRGPHEPSPPHGTRLHGEQEWEDLWQMLVQYAGRFDLVAVRLNLHLPAVHEAWHAHWQRKGEADEWRMWHTQIPLVYRGSTIGRLEISGIAQPESQFAWMAELIEGLGPFQTTLNDLVDQILVTTAAQPAPTQSAASPSVGSTASTPHALAGHVSEDVTTATATAS